MLSTPAPNSKVASLLAGRGVLAQIDIPGGDFAVTTRDLPWEICKDRIPVQPSAVLLADSMERDCVERQIETVPDKVGTVIAIGGGRAIDLGRPLVYRRVLRLITIPTVLASTRSSHPLLDSSRMDARSTSARPRRTLW